MYIIQTSLSIDKINISISSFKLNWYNFLDSNTDLYILYKLLEQNPRTNKVLYIYNFNSPWKLLSPSVIRYRLDTIQKKNKNTHKIKTTIKKYENHILHSILVSST